MILLNQIFTVKSGDFHAVKELDKGDIPLVSCGDINHGLVGYFDVPEQARHENVITVAYNGQPLTAKFRPYVFGAKDDIGILEPRCPIGIGAMVYIAAVLNSKRWRYSYGRKCFKNKLERIELDVPITIDDGQPRLDEDRINCLLGDMSFDMRPTIAQVQTRLTSKTVLVEKRLDKIFDLKRGDFHSLKPLAKGDNATVSRTESDNGVVGYFERPNGSTLYPPGLITVSSVTGDAFVQMEPFIVTDNVVVCTPLKPMQPTTAFYIAAMINKQKWRYGYGRQCYVNKLSAMTIRLPWKNKRMDESTMASYVKGQPYWPYVRSHINVK